MKVRSPRKYDCQRNWGYRCRTMSSLSHCVLQFAVDMNIKCSFAVKFFKREKVKKSEGWRSFAGCENTHNKHNIQNGTSIINIVAAFRGMHVSPAKHSYAWLPRKCDYRTDRQTDRQTDGRTDRQTLDKVISMCRYATQATQKGISIPLGWFRSSLFLLSGMELQRDFAFSVFNLQNLNKKSLP